MMKKIILFLGILIFTISSCYTIKLKEKTSEQTLIVLSKAHRKKVYEKWLKTYDDALVVKSLYHTNKDSVKFLLKHADGFLITGGVDVNPDIYGKGREIDKCGAIDSKRDSLETLIIRYAYENKVPILGVCRGEQIINVISGGTLIIDIPTDFGKSLVHRKENEFAYHNVRLKKNSLLYDICKVDSGIVNSAHHQAVDKLAEKLFISARSNDNLPEAIELKDTTQHPCFIGVQWHPERMKPNSNLAKPIGRYFLFKCKNKKR